MRSVHVSENFRLPAVGDYFFWHPFSVNYKLLENNFFRASNVSQKYLEKFGLDKLVQSLNNNRVCTQYFFCSHKYDFTSKG